MSNLSASCKICQCLLSTSVLLAVALLAGCGSSNDGYPTAAPTPQAVGTGSVAPPESDPRTVRHPEDPFWVFSLTLRESLQTGDVHLLIERLRSRTITCMEADVPPHIGGPQCFTVGETFEGLYVGRWRSEGGVVPVAQVVEQLSYFGSSARRDLSDSYGAGSLEVYALNSQPERHVAIITAIINSPPGFGGADTIRVSFGTYWSLEGKKGRLTGMITNYIYGSEFLEPAPEVQAGLFPEWERFAP